MTASAARIFVVACFVASCPLVACSGTPKPLPGGPPPEYEPARTYDGGVGEPAATGQPAPGTPAPLPE